MQTTNLEMNKFDGFIASSILKTLSYNYHTGASAHWGGTSKGFFSNLDYYSLLQVLRMNVGRPEFPYGYAGVDPVLNNNYSKEFFLNQVAKGLTEIPSTIKVYTLNYDKGIKVWVISSNLSANVQMEYCSYFADMVEENLDPNYLFDFRIIGENSDLFNEIPNEAKIWGEG